MGSILNRLADALKAKTNNAQRQRPAKTHRISQVEHLERREVFSANALEVYAVALINEMRSDPPQFGEELQRLYQGGNFQSGHGMSANDPVWEDLRDQIRDREGDGWYSGFDGRGGMTFMSVISSLPKTRPLAIIDELDERAEDHTDWMMENGYAHSGSLPSSRPGSNPEGMPVNLDATPDEKLSFAENPGLRRIGENIGYHSGGLQHSFDAYRRGEITWNGYQQRAVYASTIGFMLEHSHTIKPDADPITQWGHLFNLASFDPVTAESAGFGLSSSSKKGELSIFNGIGIDFDFFESPVYGRNDGLRESFYVTHSLGYFEDRSYVMGLIYSDDNGNRFYDPGEGRAGQLNYALDAQCDAVEPVCFSESGILQMLSSTGYADFEFKKPTGQGIEFSATYGSRTLGGYNSRLDKGNRLYSFNVSRDFNLTRSIGSGSDEPTMTRDFTESLAGGFSLGTASPEHPLGGDVLALSIHNSTDEDLFDFSLDGTADADDYLRLTFDDSDGDIDLRLYERTATGLVELGTSRSTTDNEEISLDGLDAGDYVAKVECFAGCTNFYSIELKVDMTVNEHPSLFTLASDGAWWATNVDTGEATIVAQWSGRAGWQDPIANDFNGDGLTDLAARAANGQWWVGIAGPRSFNVNRWGAWRPRLTWSSVVAGDFNGDQMTDIAGRASNGTWIVSSSNGILGFDTAPWAAWRDDAGWKLIRKGDFNGDQRDDIIGQTSNGSWWVAESVGTRFQNRRVGHWSPNIDWQDVRTGDFDANGKDDLIGRHPNGTWWVGHNDGTSLEFSPWDRWSPLTSWNHVRIGDVNGDGRDDIFGLNSNGQLWVGQSTGTTFESSTRISWSATAADWNFALLADIDEDGDDDLLVRNRQNQWWLGRNDAGEFTNEPLSSWPSQVDGAIARFGTWTGEAL